MSIPVFGTHIDLKSMIRRLCLATAVACIMWAMWKHTDHEYETLR